MFLTMVGPLLAGIQIETKRPPTTADSYFESSNLRLDLGLHSISSSTDGAAQEG